ncbi:MAG: glycosyltransferase, partial [bacterium]
MNENVYDGKINGLKYISFYESSGYGNAARSYLHAVRRAGIPFTWSPMVPGRALGLGYEPFKGKAIGDPDLDRFCNRQIDYDAVIIHTVPEYFPFCIKQESNNTRTFGYTVWETDKIPRHWPALLNLVDHLLVPCHWNREVFRQGSVKTPIDVVPHIFEEKEPIKGGFPWDIPPSDYMFYTIGVWTERKAVWNVVRCYLDTFTAHDPTLLVIKTTGKDLTRRFFRKWLGSTKYAVSKIIRRYRSPARIMLIDNEISDQDILRLHYRGDCYISLCRSEGWGLGAFDAAGYGKPVIMTGFGGQLDYLHRDLAFLVDYS